MARAAWRQARASARSAARRGATSILSFLGLFAGDPPAEFVALLEEIAVAVPPPSLRTQLSAMAVADQRDLLPHIAVPTLLIWGELSHVSPLSVDANSSR